MMKLTGFCIVLFAVLGLINDYSKRKREDIAMLYDFMLLLEKGAFYLAGERMKAPQFFSSIEERARCLMRAAREWEKCFQTGAVRAERRAGGLCGRMCFAAGYLMKK